MPSAVCNPSLEKPVTNRRGINDRNVERRERSQELLARALESMTLDGKQVLVIIPEGTRTAPIPLLTSGGL